MAESDILDLDDSLLDAPRLDLTVLSHSPAKLPSTLPRDSAGKFVSPKGKSDAKHPPKRSRSQSPSRASSKRSSVPPVQPLDLQSIFSSPDLAAVIAQSLERHWATSGFPIQVSDSSSLAPLPGLSRDAVGGDGQSVASIGRTAGPPCSATVPIVSPDPTLRGGPVTSSSVMHGTVGSRPSTAGHPPSVLPGVPATSRPFDGVVRLPVGVQPSVATAASQHPLFPSAPPQVCRPSVAAPAVVPVPHLPAGSGPAGPSVPCQPHFHMMDVDDDSSTAVGSAELDPVDEFPREPERTAQTQFRLLAREAIPEYVPVSSSLTPPGSFPAGTLRAPQVRFALNPSPSFVDEFHSQEKTWFTERAPCTSSTDRAPRNLRFPSPLPLHTSNWFDGFTRLTPNEQDLFQANSMRSVSVPVASFRKLDIGANEIMKATSVLDSVLGPCCAMVGSTPDKTKPEQFIFNDAAREGEVGLMFSALADVAQSLRSLAVDMRLRLLSVAREHVIRSGPQLLAAEATALSCAPVHADSLFSPQSVDSVAHSVAARQRDQHSQQLLEQVAKRPRLMPPPPPGRPVTSTRFTPSFRGRTRGRGRGQSGIHRGRRAAASTSTVAQPSQPFH